jgi:hypothetical protein
MLQDTVTSVKAMSAYQGQLRLVKPHQQHLSLVLSRPLLVLLLASW